jgi:hypothetical protein
MSPIITTGFFLVMGLYSAFAMVNDLKTGTAQIRGGTIDVKEFPGWFYLLIFIKAAFICLAVAVVLHAFDLVGDPFIWMHQNLPFLMPRQ